MKVPFLRCFLNSSKKDCVGEMHPVCPMLLFAKSRSLEKHAPLDWNMGLVHGTIGSIGHDRDYHQ